MSLNATPRGERVHIAIFGRRNVGKSRLINALTGQEVSIVSDVMGTTTDPVAKAMELLPLGPIVIIDTPGLDDEGALGALRVQRTRDVLNRTDVALLVTDAAGGFGACERELAAAVREKKLPLVLVFNKADLAAPPEAARQEAAAQAQAPVHVVSAATGAGVEDLKLALARIVPEDDDKFRIVGDLLRPADVVVLVTPIDKAAPKGRLILPQQQTIRDVLEADAIAVVTKEFELRETLASLGRPPRLVVTDSQVFAKVAADVPPEVWLTSFSILFARYKGDYDVLKAGVDALDKLRDGDRVLIVEGCTHRRQCDDIGTVKIPKWLKAYTRKDLALEFASGAGWPEDLSPYALIIHCGGCMLPRREIKRRILDAQRAGVPIANYGLLIAKLRGVFDSVVS